MVAALITLAVVLSALTGWAAQLNSHCSSREASAQVRAGHQLHRSQPPLPAWTDYDRHDCEHCPVPECSGLDPCAMSAVGIVVTPVATPGAMTMQRVALSTRHGALPIPSIQPPTPQTQIYLFIFTITTL